MSTPEQQEGGAAEIIEAEDENYAPPPQKTIEEIIVADQDDESLRRYKEALLGDSTKEKIIVYPDDPRKVIVQKLSLVVPGREDVFLDLTGDLSKLKQQVFTIKEAVQYQIKIDFTVQREIVHGLKYVQKTSRFAVNVDKMVHMVGSYPPRKEVYSYLTPLDESPSGMVARGSYTVNSLFTDDDKNEHLKWEWAFEIKKDWN